VNLHAPGGGDFGGCPSGGFEVKFGPLTANHSSSTNIAMTENVPEPMGPRLPPASGRSVAESHFRRLLEKLPAGAYTCDPEGLITYYNQHAVELWGRSPKLNDPVDRFCGSFRLFSKDGSPLTHDQCWMALALRAGEGFNAEEIVIQRPDGRRLTALAHANPIYDDSGTLLGAVNVLVDISDRKRTEVALRDADHSKNEFIAMLAHELRNPLAPLRNAVAIVRLKGAPSSELQWVLDVIDRQMQQMTRLIDELLDIARITHNKLDLRRDRIELGSVLQAAVEASRPSIEAAGQEFIVSTPPEPIFLDGDPARLAQVLCNLLNNASKYTQEGGRIWLHAQRQGSDAVITVGDSGIGISSEMLPHIFEMFTQAARAPAGSQSGLGIGLALANRLVEMHGGVITVESGGPGQGSEFTVRLPAVFEPSFGLRPLERRSVATISAFPLRILVVDDNEDSAGTSSMLLRIMGNDIRTAADGVEALAVADEFRPHVVLLDIGLPKMSGYEVAGEIRRQPWGKGMVLIAVTGWSQPADRDRAKEAGFDHHLVKPVDPATVIQLLAPLEQTLSACAERSH
jgi:PAS domain S-box-containing protein